MKTRFSHRTRHVSPGAFISFAIVVIVLLLILILRFFAPSLFTSLVTPLWIVGSSVTGGDTALRTLQLEKENAALKDENALLRAGSNARKEYTEAVVLSRPPVTPYDVLILDAGSVDGVRVGMRVYKEGIPLGVIENVSERQSTASLFSSGGRTLEASVGEIRLPITLSGAGAGAFRADAPRDSGITPGMPVYAPGSDVPLGIVEKVETHPSAPRATLFISPSTNVFSLRGVIIAP